MPSTPSISGWAALVMPGSTCASPRLGQRPWPRPQMLPTACSRLPSVALLSSTGARALAATPAQAAFSPVPLHTCSIPQAPNHDLRYRPGGLLRCLPLPGLPLPHAHTGKGGTRRHPPASQVIDLGPIPQGAPSGGPQHIATRASVGHVPMLCLQAAWKARCGISPMRTTARRCPWTRGVRRACASLRR